MAKRNFSYIYLILIALLCVQCTHTINLKSRPTGAKVFSLDKSGNRSALLGQTPLTLSDAKATNLSAIEIEKAGFFKQQILIPFREASNVDINVTLSRHNEAWFKEMLLDSYAGTLDKVTSDLIQLQSDIASNRQAEVEAQIARYKTQYDKIPTFHTMVGGYYLFIKNDKARARQAFTKALELDPTNQDARRLLSEGGK